WACESGQIDESGLFTAPQTPSRIKGTAVDPETRIAGNPLVEVEATHPAIVALEGEPAERTIEVKPGGKIRFRAWGKTAQGVRVRGRRSVGDVCGDPSPGRASISPRPNPAATRSRPKPPPVDCTSDGT
ncbi:MAG: hypothetical protein ACYTHN_23935, partial [Planctomycetota bacterium]